MKDFFNNIFKKQENKQEKPEMEEKQEMTNLETEELMGDASEVTPENTAEQAQEEADKTDKTDKTAELTAELAEMKDKYLRLAAEFENYKRRTTKERLELLDTAARETIVALLPVVDDFDRAVAANEKVDDIEALKDGFKLIQQRFGQILERRGLKAMDSSGSNFDVDLHQAVTELAMGEEMKGKVIDTVEKGFKLNDKIIRFAKVVVGA